MTVSPLVKLVTVRAAAQSGRTRQIRLAAGLSLRELADAVGVGASTLYRWETGDRRPRGDAALRYAELLNELAEATAS
jgi:transcriptional regulator with XRE-family HTH domain